MLMLFPLSACQIPVLAGTAAVSVFRGLKNRHSKKREAATKSLDNGSAGNGAAKQHVHMAFERVHCSITDKRGNTKTILDNVSGTAKPGRC